MQELLNQHSFLVIAVFIALLWVPAVLRYAPGVWRWGLLGFLFLALGTFQLALHTAEMELATAEAVQTALSSREPIFLEIYSNF